MAIKVEHRVKRILEPIRLFTSIDDFQGNLPSDIRIHEDEILGVYNFNSNALSLIFWVSKHGIWLYKDAWQFVAFSEIGDIKLPPKANKHENQINITMYDNTQYDLTVIGCRGRLRDIFEVGRFLDRVTRKNQ